MEILNYYGVKLSHALQTMLDTHLNLPESSTIDDMQWILNQPSGQLELKPEIVLMLKKSLTLKILQQIYDDLQLVLEPIMTQLEFLVYFHLNNCEMFKEYLKSQIAKISTNSEQPAEESAIVLSVSPDVTAQSDTNPDDKILQVIFVHSMKLLVIVHT